MKRTFAAATVALILSGCSTLEPNFVDGKEYAGPYPVLHSGTIEDFEFPDKDGNMQSFLQASANTLDTGAGTFGNLLSMTTGLSSVGGGLVVGVAALVLEGMTSKSAPAHPQVVVRTNDGDIERFETPPHLIERTVKFNCLDIGEPVKVVNDGNAFMYLMHADTRLRRSTALDPSCDSLREKYGVPLVRSTQLTQ